jgi:hypothetical protein
MKPLLDYVAMGALAICPWVFLAYFWWRSKV